MADLVDEILYLNAKVEADFERAILETPEPLRGERWYGDWSIREIALHLATWDSVDVARLGAIVTASEDPSPWSGPEETDRVNAELIAEHADQDFDGVIEYAAEAQRQLHEAIEGLRALPSERFWADGSLLRRMAMHSATHRTHHLLPILEWHASRGGASAS